MAWTEILTALALVLIIEGMVPSLYELPAGCRFHNRCPHAGNACQVAPPEIDLVAEEHRVACTRWRELR